MLFEVSDEEKKKAKLPHDLFLINLIGNHILTFVATLGLASSWAWPMLIVPVVSFLILGIIIYKGMKSREKEPWFVMCHWQVALKRSLFFIKMLLAITAIAAFGLYGYTSLGWMKEAVYAVIGGVCLLPTMVTTLVLIIMESDALHQAGDGKLPDKMIDLYPNPEARIIDSVNPDKAT
ncbi:MAG: hypothetical protein KZQ64_07570 [gamma proteobacterium symbiont of Bathyaustriella thionipta]|nr:hypothetical protein [gamma proteobacterium symbiont of Bathyaustriella thionipta]MCU7949505.1 hypothetical protein [gamma proteobacterium symbiont of Bathyaustriella thionipta]MCU7953230.1 hypothetical protein [gamma proteobacterium symbiont of Bathyaustriella thionipta]MCU7956091.1 hypothetical protein [gamma proteobacterium symbiont of Bathyaustriella thionipta]MCU7967786.1 hypothetical protein [gamma proteobacterium symbiont of Bathyaustriella thionipta]